MLPCSELSADLVQAIDQLARQPLPELLLQHGVLRQLARDALLRRLRDSVQFSPEEEPQLLSTLWEGVPADPPASLSGNWLGALPEALQGPMQQRWDQIRQQKWIEDMYRDKLEPYFLERRADLEQVVYGMIRLKQQGTAEELYLRLLDDDADFGDLASRYSQGEERFTRGLVGPMLISQPHATIRTVLQSLTVGEIHPPFRVDKWVLLVQMAHRQPARLNDATRLQLYNELFEQEVNATLDSALQELYPQLLAGHEAAPALAAEDALQLTSATLTEPQPVVAELVTTPEPTPPPPPRQSVDLPRSSSIASAAPATTVSGASSTAAASVSTPPVAPEPVPPAAPSTVPAASAPAGAAPETSEPVPRTASPTLSATAAPAAAAPVSPPEPVPSEPAPPQPAAPQASAASSAVASKDPAPAPPATPSAVPTPATPVAPAPAPAPVVPEPAPPAAPPTVPATATQAVAAPASPSQPVPLQPAATKNTESPAASPLVSESREESVASAAAQDAAPSPPRRDPPTPNTQSAPQIVVNAAGEASASGVGTGAKAGSKPQVTAEQTASQKGTVRLQGTVRSEALARPKPAPASKPTAAASPAAEATPPLQGSSPSPVAEAAAVEAVEETTASASTESEAT